MSCFLHLKLIYGVVGVNSSGVLSRIVIICIRSGTDLISLLILFFLWLLGRPVQKKPNAPSFQIGSGWNLSGILIKWIRIDWWSRIFDLTS